jgi:uncharacterized protein (DUF1330 family)
MAKGYWVTTYTSVSDPAALARYAGPAAKAIAENGGRILVRGLPVKVFEGSAESQRCVVVEFDGVEAAIAAYENPEYQKIAATLHGGVERELRIMEGA